MNGIKKIASRLWHLLTDPHPEIRGRDQRRMATLLSALLLGLICSAVFAEAIATALIAWEEEYTGYRQTIVVVIFLILAYGVSRTKHYQRAAFLAIIVSVFGVFASTLAEPRGALGGLLDYLVIPIFLGSMFLNRRETIIITGFIVVGLLLLPAITPIITMDLILIGPLSYVLIITSLVFLSGYTRNLLENDRQQDLILSEQRARQRLAKLQALRTIDMAVASHRDLSKTLDIILEQLISSVNMDVAVILLLNKTNQVLEYAAARGLRTQALRYTRLRVGQGIAGVAAQERTIVHVADLRKSHFLFSQAPLLKDEGVISYLAVPLISDDQVKGVLEIFYRNPFEPDEEWKAFLESLANQTAIAIDLATLFSSLQTTNTELLNAYDSTIEGWSRALDLRDKETVGHTLRVTELTLRLAQVMGLGPKDMTYIRWGALLHDIGKMGIPDAILLKPGPLTDEERLTMQKHPVYANEMLLHIDYLRPALDIPYCHHEKWDGTGYPRGLKGEEIPLAARIFAVIDVWDALSSDRPYRRAWPSDKVLEYIKLETGTHFDPQVVRAFLKLWQERPETPEL
ncbi:MAG TPA: HD domain-containing phosphohydrolase [Anaerolineales bacterium]|nr:HD domain-containing phosphohydrolase [Anaerolineales bacterium]